MVKKNTWGRYTWLLFHTCVYKVKNENDYNTINTLKSFVSKICNLIPCSTCREHSIEYLRKNNINTVKTKTELKLYLYKFHNNVNKMLGEPVLDVSTCDKIYENKILKNVLYNFHKILNVINYAANYMFLSKKKLNFTNEYVNYFRNNIHKYNE